MMSYQIWTRFFVVSLIILGNCAYTSEVIHQADAKASTFNHAFETTPSESSDDAESNWQPMLIAGYKAQAKSNFSYQTLSNISLAEPGTVKYQYFNPRAPPNTTA